MFAEDKFWVYSAVVSPDGEYLLFNAYGAPGGAGGEDIYVAQKNSSGWSLAKPIDPKVNTVNEEGSPRFSRDGKYFFFGRAENLGDYEYGEWSIFVIDTEALQLDRLFE